MSCPFAARTQPRRDNTTVVGSLVSSSVSEMACAASRSTNLVRRSSPYSSASLNNSSRTRRVSRALLFNMPSTSSRSALSSFCSSRIFISSSRAKWRSLVSSMASACSSDSLKRLISTGFG